MSIPGFLNNSETWNMNKGETKQIETAELQSLKNLFDLPLHTPNAAIIFTFGTLYTKLRIDQKQFIYLHRILNRENGNWTRKTLSTLEDMKIGWYKCIQENLADYQLPTDFSTIKNIAPNEWKFKVQDSIEKRNKERLNAECLETTEGVTKEKTKTVSLLKHLTFN